MPKIDVDGQEDYVPKGVRVLWRGVAVLALASTVPALAQTGSIRSNDAPATLPREGRFTGDAARAISDKFAACVVKRHYQPVIKALQMERDTPDQYKALHRLLDPECWGGNGLENQSSGNDIQMTTNPLSFRGALAKAVVRKDFERHPATFGAVAVASGNEGDRWFQMADCIVRRDPATSLRLLVAVAGTSQELAAIDALKPQMSECLFQGDTVVFTKDLLVSNLAEAYVREAQAPRSANAG